MDLKKRRKQRSTMEVLAHDVVEQILERLPPKSLLRFKSVSKQWKSTIEFPFFQHKHLNRHRQRQISKTPDLLMINTGYKDRLKRLESITTLELESSISRNIPIPWENNLYFFCQNSVDGLVCLFDVYDSVIIFNPTTRWYRTLPPSIYQQKNDQTKFPYNSLGFGKDQINGLYKLVWLYNNSVQENTATCEVFDFEINAWRFVEPSSPRKVDYCIGPVYVTGLLYWLTLEEEGPFVLSFDLHTETFEIVCEAPDIDPYSEIWKIFNLDDNLCASNRFDGGHEIWSLNLEEKTWKKIYFIDLAWICPPIEGYCRCDCDVRPLVTVEEKKKKLMLCDYDDGCETRGKLVIYESHTTSYCRVVSKRKCSISVCYFQSLNSIV